MGVGVELSVSAEMQDKVCCVSRGRREVAHWWWHNHAAVLTSIIDSVHTAGVRVCGQKRGREGDAVLCGGM